MRRLLLALLLAAPAAAGPALPDEAAAEQALEADPSVAAARARLAAARAEARALAAGPHELVASASFATRRVDRGETFAEYEASLSRAIRLPGKAALDRKAGAAAVRAAANMAEDARHQAATLLADLWWDWVGAAAERQVLERSVATLEAASAAVARRLALGDAAAIEAEQAEGALASARSAARAAAGREAGARAALSARFPTLPLPRAAPEVPPPELPAEGLAALAELARARSHELAAALARAERAALHAERTRRDRFADPSVGVRGFSEFGGAERGVGLLLQIPIGGVHRKALAEEAEAQALATRAEALAVEGEVAARAGQGLAAAAAAHAAWAAAAKATEAVARAARRAERGHALGGSDLAERLYAERLAQEAGLAEAMARVAAWRAITRLRIDSHTLWLREDPMPMAEGAEGGAQEAGRP